MLVSQVVDRAVDKSASLQDGLDLLWSHPQVLAELRELFELLQDRFDHLHLALDDRPEVPLQVHARYSRLEILAAFAVGTGAKVGAWQTGVRWLPKAKADLFTITLDKTDGAFSPTTRYRDYAISRELIHWESQSVTRADSETGTQVPEPRRTGERRDAVRPPAAQRASVLVSRTGDLRGAQWRTANGRGVEAQASPPWRSVRFVRGGCGVARSSLGLAPRGSFQ